MFYIDHIYIIYTHIKWRFVLTLYWSSVLLFKFLETKSRFLSGCLNIKYEAFNTVCVHIVHKKEKLENSTQIGIEPSTSLPRGDSANRYAAAAVIVIYRGSHFYSELVAIHCAFINANSLPPWQTVAILQRSVLRRPKTSWCPACKSYLTNRMKEQITKKGSLSDFPSPFFF